MTSTSRKKCIQVSIVLVFLSLLFFVATPQSRVQAASRVPVERCAVLLIHLHGNRPVTSTCLAWGKLVNGKMIPDTQTANCFSSGITLQIQSYYNGDVCFTGNGYLGIKLDAVWQINTYNYGGWVLYYDGGPGYKYYLNSGGLYNCNDSPFCGYGVEITQVDVYNN